MRVQWLNYSASGGRSPQARGRIVWQQTRSSGARRVSGTDGRTDGRQTVAQNFLRKLYRPTGSGANSSAAEEPTQHRRLKIARSVVGNDPVENR